MQRILKLNQHTVVCGFGRHASVVCTELNKQGLPFVVIETDPEKIELLRRDTSYLFIHGDATSDEVLRQAGIERALALVVTVPLDANNLFIVLSARQLNPALKIISRLNNPADELKLRRAGANHVVRPEQIGGFYMATLINKPDLIEFFNLISNLGNSKVVFEEIQVARLKKQLQHKSIKETGIYTATQVPILGLKHTDGHYQLNPDTNTILEPEMFIVILGAQEQIDRFYAWCMETDHNSQF